MNAGKILRELSEHKRAEINETARNAAYLKSSWYFQRLFWKNERTFAKTLIFCVQTSRIKGKN